MPDWFLDWSDHPVVIIASGPSAKDYDYNEFRGKAKFMVVNKSWELAPWADVVIGADAGWWKKRNGMPDFPGLKITLDFNISRMYPDVKLLQLMMVETGICVNKPGFVGKGRNSGFYALNLGIQFKSKKCILSGFDMTLENGVHWHGLHENGLNNPRDSTVKTWRKILDNQAGTIKKLGVQVINVSKASALTAYPKMTLSEALA